MSNYSLLRDAEYKHISELDIDGKILDIGGSKKSGYHKLIKGNNEIITANIDSSYGCDLVFDVQSRFPLEDKQYDAVTCFNVLEHIYGFHNVFTEVNRVLKGDGMFIFAIPFMFNVHGSPDDYFRYTKSCINKLLVDNGFVVTKIDSIGDGVFSLVFQIIGGSLPAQALRRFVRILFVGTDNFLKIISKRYRLVGERIPIGYYVIARKSVDL